MNDFKIFLMYIFNPRGLIEGFKEGFAKIFKPKTLSVILILTAFVSLFLFPDQKNCYVTIVLLIIAFVIQLRIAYIGGDHRYWWKQKMAEKDELKEYR